MNEPAASESSLRGVAGVVGFAGAAGGAAAAVLAGVCALAMRRRRRPTRKTPADKPPPEHDDAEPDLIPNHYCESVQGITPRRPFAADDVSISSVTNAVDAPVCTPHVIYARQGCNGRGAAWSWGDIGAVSNGAIGGAVGGVVGSASDGGLGADGRPGRPAASESLNVDDIKEKLLDQRIPESCV